MAPTHKEQRASARRDTLTGKLLEEMSLEDQDTIWARRLAASAQDYANLQTKFETVAAARANRRSALPTNDPLPTHDLERMKDALDLTEHYSWFKKLDPKLDPASLRFAGFGEWSLEANENPSTWYKFIATLNKYTIWQDLRYERANDQIMAKDTEISELQDQVRSMRSSKQTEKLLAKLTTGQEKLRAALVTASEDNNTLQAENQELQDRLESVLQEKEKTPSHHSSESSDDEDSNDGFLNGLKLHDRRHVRFTQHITDTDERDRTRTRSPTYSAATARKRSLRPPNKVDTFTGEDREKYQEWYSKIVGQIDANPEYFEDREDLKLNYLFQHLTGATFDLLDDEYGPRARARDPGLTFDGAIRQLDRAYYPQDTYRTARAKLENLHMGAGESFAEFYPKFQAQIVRLKLADKHRADELTKRLTRRYAEKVITGVDEPYATIVNRLYTLDSQLQLYNSSHKSEARENVKTTSSRTIKASRSISSKTTPATNSSGDKKNHETIELGKPPKPLQDMTDSELKAYLDALPRSKVISDRCMRGGHCHACQCQGHMKSNPSCPAKRLERVGANTLSIDDEQGKGLA